MANHRRTLKRGYRARCGPHNKSPRRGQHRRGSAKHSRDELAKCTVCGTSDSRYKCPKCRDGYCSVGCCRAHRATCSSVEAAAAATGAAAAASAMASGKFLNNGTNHRGFGDVVVSKYLPDGVMVCGGEGTPGHDEDEDKSCGRSGSRRPDEDEDEDDGCGDEEGWRMTESMKEAIDKSDWLRTELTDGGLRQIIETIDSAGSYLDRELALARAKAGNPTFAAFVDKLLLTAGILEEEGGSGGGCLVLTAENRKANTVAVLASDDGSGDYESASSGGRESGDAEDSTNSSECSDSDSSADEESCTSESSDGS